MDINEAREKAKEIRVEGYGARDSAFFTKGFIEAWDSQQAIIDKQREEIEELKKVGDILAKAYDKNGSWLDVDKALKRWEGLK